MWSKIIKNWNDSLTESQNKTTLSITVAVVGSAAHSWVVCLLFGVTCNQFSVSLYREPVPGAGGHHPDQAERTHRSSAQSRRHRQHDHAGGHGLRNELFHGTVDPPQEIQTHHQHFLREPGALQNPPPKLMWLYTYTSGPTGAPAGCQGEKDPPFYLMAKMESFLVLFPSFTLLLFVLMLVGGGYGWLCYGRHLFSIRWGKSHLGYVIGLLSAPTHQVWIIHFDKTLEVTKKRKKQTQLMLSNVWSLLADVDYFSAFFLSFFFQIGKKKKGQNTFCSLLIPPHITQICEV